MSVSENDRTVSRQIINIAIIIHIPEISAIPAFHKNRRTSTYRLKRPRRAVNPANNMLKRFIIKQLRLLPNISHYISPSKLYFVITQTIKNILTAGYLKPIDFVTIFHSVTTIPKEVAL